MFASSLKNRFMILVVLFIGFLSVTGFLVAHEDPSPSSKSSTTEDSHFHEEDTGGVPHAHTTEEESDSHAHDESEHSHEEEGVVEVPLDLIPSLGLVAEPVRSGSFTQGLDLYGWIRPRNQDITELKSLVTLKVEEIHVQLGQNVEEGSPLLTYHVPEALELQEKILNSLHTQIHQRQLKAHLEAEGQAKMVEFLGELRIAMREKNRIEEDLNRLKQTGTQTVPQKDIVSREWDLNMAVANFQAKHALALIYGIDPALLSETELGTADLPNSVGVLSPEYRRLIEEADFLVHRAEDEIEVACLKLASIGFPKEELDALRSGNHSGLSDKLTIRARSSGIITRLEAKLKSVFNPGELLLCLVDYKKIYADIEVPESEISQVMKRTTDHIPVIIPGQSDKSFLARVVVFDTSIHPDIRKAHLMLELDNTPDLMLRENMAVNALIPLAEKDNTLSVPRSAVLTDGFEKIVFVEEGKGHYHRVSVKTGLENLNSIEILEGLDHSDRVVTSAARVLLLASKTPTTLDAHAGHSH